MNGRQILKSIDADLDRIESGDEPLFLYYHEETGPLVPINWLDRSGHSEWEHDWEQFMEGQTCLLNGFFIRDVARFIGTRILKHG